MGSTTLPEELHKLAIFAQMYSVQYRVISLILACATMFRKTIYHLLKLDGVAALLANPHVNSTSLLADTLHLHYTGIQLKNVSNQG